LTGGGCKAEGGIGGVSNGEGSGGGENSATRTPAALAASVSSLPPAVRAEKPAPPPEAPPPPAENPAPPAIISALPAEKSAPPAEQPAPPVETQDAPASALDVLDRDSAHPTMQGSIDTHTRTRTDKNARSDTHAGLASAAAAG